MEISKQDVFQNSKLISPFLAQGLQQRQKHSEHFFLTFDRKVYIIDSCYGLEEGQMVVKALHEGVT